MLLNPLIYRVEYNSSPPITLVACMHSNIYIYI